MGFPFSYKGFVKCPNDVPIAWFQGQFLRKAKEQFEAARAEVDLHENSLSFRTTLRAFPYWFNKEAGSLAHIPRGTMYFQPTERRINYVLNFKVPVVIFTIGIIGLFGSFFMFVVNGPFLTRISIILIAWLIMLLVTYCGGILGFKGFLRRLLGKL
jgi:hypothetical protein